MLTYKVKLRFWTEKARAYWVERLRLVRDCYTYASKIVFDEKLPLKLKEYHKRLYKEIRAAFPGLSSQMCIKVEMLVLANYRTVAEQKKKEEKERKGKREWCAKKGLPYHEEPPEEEEEKPIEMTIQNF